MKRPEPLKKSDLVHPKDSKSQFNGDQILPKEAQGFDARRKAQGLTTTEGTHKPKNVKPRKGPEPCYQIKPLPDDHRYEPALRRVVPNPQPLTDRQKRMLHRGGKKDG